MTSTSQKNGTDDLGGDAEMNKLLKEQADFALSRKAPAAFATRVPKPSGLGGTAEDGGKGEHVGQKRPASLFKQLRQKDGLLGQPGASARPFGVPTSQAPHPEIAQLPDIEGPEKEDLSCLSDSIFERCAPGTERAKEPRLGDREGAYDAPATGFPQPTHRSVGKFLGRTAPQLKVGERPDSRPASKGPKSEAEEIDEENRRTLDDASPEEILEWQKQLLAQFGPETCNFFKKRAQAKDQAQQELKAAVSTSLEQEKEDPKKEQPAAKRKSVTFEDVDPEESTIAVESNGALNGKEASRGPGGVRMELFSTSANENSAEVSADPGFQGDAVDMLCDMVGGCMDRHELQKLQWTVPPGQTDLDAVVQDASLPPETSGKVIQLLRFDFEGRICLRRGGQGADENAEEEDTFQGLHHHGAEGREAGYTLAELLLLSRSSSIPQRALALRTLAVVLEHARTPMERKLLLGDAAVERTGLPVDTKQTERRAGFGLGLSVFFWHGVGRGDLCKHLAEALTDAALPPRIAALRGVCALLDGAVGEGATATLIRGSTTEETMKISPTERLLCGSLEYLRELVWPHCSLKSSQSLAKRHLVRVLLEEGGGGGGKATWPYLLRRCLLAAKPQVEVSGADILLPLFSRRDAAVDPNADEDEEFERKLTQEEPEPAFVPVVEGVLQILPAISGDPALQTLAIRALSAASTWSPALNQRVRVGCDAWRASWLNSIAATPTSSQEATLRFELLRFVRATCESGGREVAAWWLSPPTAKGPRGAWKEGKESWAPEVAIRRVILQVVCSSDNSPDKAEELSWNKLAACQGLYIWLSWLRSGAGVDALDSFGSSFGTYLHRVASSSETGLEDPSKFALLEAEIFSANLIYQIASELVRLGRQKLAAVTDMDVEDSIPPLSSCSSMAIATETRGLGGSFVAACAEAAPVLAKMLQKLKQSKGLTNSRGLLASSTLLRASLATFCSTAPDEPTLSQASQILLEIASSEALLPSLPEGATRHHEIHSRGAYFDEDAEAPWPFVGGGGRSERLLRLASLKAAEASVDLAKSVEKSTALPWLRTILRDSSEKVATLAGESNFITRTEDGSTVVSEGLIGPVQQDRWPSLLASAADAVSALEATPSSSSTCPAIANSTFSQAFRLTGSWPTMKKLLSTLGLTLGSHGEEAVLRAAYRPEAPWAWFRVDAMARAVRASGNAIGNIPRKVLSLPDTSGAPSLSFAMAFFWSLAGGIPKEAALEVLEVLSKPSAKALFQSVPPWLPFISIIAFVGAPLGRLKAMDDEEYAWKLPTIRPALEEVVERHLRGLDPTPWLSAGTDWLGETMTGLAHRLSKTFSEESYGDPLIAKLLWSFAAADMPLECRQVCWGSRDEALLAHLTRALPVQGKSPSKRDPSLLWPLKSYLEHSGECGEQITIALESGLLRPKTWPFLFALHQKTEADGGHEEESPLREVLDNEQDPEIDIAMSDEEPKGVNLTQVELGDLD